VTERNYGSFVRTFTVPAGVDLDKVRATLADGVLTVIVPKKPETQGKKVPISATSGESSSWTRPRTPPGKHLTSMRRRRTMEDILREDIPFGHWSSLAWRAVASVIFGILAFVLPGVTLLALTLLFGAYAFTDGVLAFVVATRPEHRRHLWLLFFEGVCGVVAGAITFVLPGLSLLALVYVIAARAAIVGGLQIGGAIGFRGPAGLRILYALGGLASLLFSVVTFALPGISALVLLTFLAAYSIFFGVVLFALALRVRTLTRGSGGQVPQAA
jgi:uncharacterized membrane protein HdeD (DUF308 family)